jgi:hypothetical protein
MKRVVRPSTAADAPAIIALFAQAGIRPNEDSQALFWKYWQERADWPGPRSFVLTRGSDLIAHGAMIPGTLAWGKHRNRTAQVIDWVALRGEIGAGVTLMKHIGQQVDSLISIGGSTDTLRILPHIGFRAVGAATGYVRPLFPLRVLRGTKDSTWKSLARCARNIAWKLSALAPGSAGWQARRLTGTEDLDQLASVLPTPGGLMAVLERGLELFRYTLNCPIVPIRLFAVANGAHIRGYFMLASVPGQVRIIDCWVNSVDRADWRAMTLCAVEQAMNDPQAAEVVIWASDPLLAETLDACGFHARYDNIVQVRSAIGAAFPPSQLRVQMLDTDEAYLSDGHPQFWA